MPYAITAVDRQPGASVYVLGRRETFTVLALTFTLESVSGGDVTTPVVDYRDPTGGIIYRQILAVTEYQPSFWSLSPAAEPFATDGFANSSFPQYLADRPYTANTARLSPIALTGACAVAVLAVLGAPDATTDPYASLNPDAAIADLHLWVEGREPARSLPPRPAPLLAHVAG